jgi:hypothetical protein
MVHNEIEMYIKGLDASIAGVALALAHKFDQALPTSEAKVWHGHPVWFLDENPIVGFSLKKVGLEVLFWSGKSFKVDGLKPVGKYQAAALPITTTDDVESATLTTALEEAIAIQWDYKNLVKNRGELVKLNGSH